MIHSTKNGQYWSFWYKWWSDHQNQEVALGNRLLRPLKLQRLPRSMRLQRFLRSGKSTNEVFKVIQVLEFYNLRTNITVFWCFGKKIFLTESWKLMLNFSTFSVRGCWGQPMLLFQKLVDETQMPKPQEYTDTFILTKKLFLIVLRGLQSISNPVERPCILVALTAKEGMNKQTGCSTNFWLDTHTT